MWSRSGAVWLIVLLLIPGCTAASGLRPPSQRPARPLVYPALLPKPPEATRTADGIVYRLSVNRAVYRQGEPIVIDFASALRFDPASAFGRAAVRLLGAFDRRAIRKWRVRLERTGAGQRGDSGSSAGSRGASRAT